ncbi:fimbrial protein [Citrobacter braakii]|uniref:Long polar fimbrial protein LpfA n=1 Tax=Citrobacter braakii TaxID=57706 RepID=A0A1V8NS49_CITBR|nr:fimbrial protein [Citrobacter braakii]EBW7152297.1 long polar fimbrial protein LpfA [Salmonella enterica subsp. enterica serovar Coeln]OQM39235.1 long polar fimbrial protein LpfA [Citrobacter braakii]QXC16716.1 fimbrial protein [Citrobacter braakii]
MRNKIILAMAAAGMMCGTSAFAADIPTTDAGGGTIVFSGSVIDAPCSIVPENQNIQVDLGQVTKKSLAEADKKSSLVPFTINLAQCSFEDMTGNTTQGATNYSKVAVAFSGITAPTGGDLTKGEIANSATNNPAANVAIQLLKGDASTPVDLSKAPTAGDITLDTSSATNKLNFFARMITVGGAASQGAVGATVTYKLRYF